MVAATMDITRNKLLKASKNPVTIKRQKFMIATSTDK
jgi:hypothetical protein